MPTRKEKKERERKKGKRKRTNGKGTAQTTAESNRPFVRTTDSAALCTAHPFPFRLRLRHSTSAVPLIALGTARAMGNGLARLNARCVLTAIRRDENVRVTNAQHNIEELGFDSANFLVVEVIRDRDTADVAVREDDEQIGVFGVVVVFPVRGDNSGVGESVGADNCLADKVRLTRNVERTESLVDMTLLARLGLEVDEVSAVLAEEMDLMEEVASGRVVHLLDDGRALVPCVIVDTTTTEELHFRVNLEAIRFELVRRITVARVLCQNDGCAERQSNDGDNENLLIH